MIISYPWQSPICPLSADSVGVQGAEKTSISPVSALEFDLRNILELCFEEERPILVEAARFEVECCGPVVKFFLQRKEFGGDPSDGQKRSAWCV